MRRELVALLERLAAASASPSTPGDRADVYVRVDRNRLHAARVALTDAPLGGPQTLAAIASLLPHNGSGDAAAAVGAYARELATTFDAACAQSGGAFAAYLTSYAAPELDAARAVAVAVLDAHNELASP